MPYVAENYIGGGSSGTFAEPPSSNRADGPTDLGGRRSSGKQTVRDADDAAFRVDEENALDEEAWPDPTPPVSAPEAARPVSGAFSGGEIAGYPVLFDPENADIYPTAFPGRQGFMGVGRRAITVALDPRDMPRRIHPSCGMTLPEDIGEVPVMTIGLVGTSNAGKSQYLTALGVEIIKSQRLWRLGVGQVSPGESTQSRFHRDYFIPVIRKKLAHARTSLKAGQEAFRKPFEFRVTTPDGRRFTMLLHDVPGEYLVDGRKINQHLEFLRHVDGLIILIDPLAIDSVVAQLPDVDPSHCFVYEGPQDEVVRTIAAHLGVDRCASLPTAVCITKSDMVCRAFGSIPELAVPDTNDPIQLTREVSELDRLVRDNLMRKFEDWSLTEALTRFPNSSYHLVAALGTLPAADVDVAGHRHIPGQIRPSRVIDPVFSLLQRIRV